MEAGQILGFGRLLAHNAYFRWAAIVGFGGLMMDTIDGFSWLGRNWNWLLASVDSGYARLLFLAAIIATIIHAGRQVGRAQKEVAGLAKLDLERETAARNAALRLPIKIARTAAMRREVEQFAEEVSRLTKLLEGAKVGKMRRYSEAHDKSSADPIITPNFELPSIAAYKFFAVVLKKPAFVEMTSPHYEALPQAGNLRPLLRYDPEHPHNKVFLKSLERNLALNGGIVSQLERELSRVRRILAAADAALAEELANYER